MWHSKIALMGLKEVSMFRIDHKKCHINGSSIEIVDRRKRSMTPSPSLPNKKTAK